jgi:Rieske Fe-S protein
LDPVKLINRKTFLRLATLAVVAGFVALWNTMTGKQKLLSEKPVITRINASKLGTGIFIFDTFIVVKSTDALKVLSNKCTHAGCRINREVDGELICPCHGSKYDAITGKVLQGPAGLPLPQIPFSIDIKTGEITIKTQS